MASGQGCRSSLDFSSGHCLANFLLAFPKTLNVQFDLSLMDETDAAGIDNRDLS